MALPDSHRHVETIASLKAFFLSLGLRTWPEMSDELISHNGQVNISLLRTMVNTHPLRQLILVSKAKSDFGSLPQSVKEIVKALARYEDSEWVSGKFGVLMFKPKKPQEEVQSVIEKYRNEIPNHIYDKLKNVLKSW